MTELHQQACGDLRRKVDNVFPAGVEHIHLLVAVPLQNLEAGVVDVEVVRPVRVLIGHGPDFRGFVIDDGIHTCHVHLLTVDHEGVEHELALFKPLRGRGLRRGGVKGCRQGGWFRGVFRRPGNGEQVEGILEAEVGRVLVLGHPKIILARHRAQLDFLAGLQVHDDFGALAGAEEEGVDFHGGVEKPRVRGDDVEGTVAELQCVEAHRSTVEQAQANPARGGVEARIGDAIDQRRGAQKAQSVIALFINLAVIGELGIHDDYRDVVHTVVLRQVQVIGHIVTDEEHARQPAVGMRGRGHVRVRVVPQRGRGLDDLPLGLPGLAHLNRRVRAAIRIGR